MSRVLLVLVKLQLLPVFLTGCLLLLPSNTLAASVIQLTPATFTSAVTSKKNIVVVDFSSDGCPSCSSLEGSKLLDKLASKYPGGEVSVTQIKAKSLNGPDVKAITADLGVTSVQSFPTIEVFVGGVDKGSLSNDTSNVKLLDAWTASLQQDGAPAVNGLTPAKSTIIQPLENDGSCKLVLVTIPAADVKSANITDCANIDFYTYLNKAIDQIVPYIMIVALVMITYSGFQYMMGGAAGDVKSARARITGILGGIIFFFLIRLILNQVAPGLDLKGVAPTVANVTDPTNTDLCSLFDQPPEGDGVGGDTSQALAPSPLLVVSRSFVGVAHAATVTHNHQCFNMAGNGKIGVNGVPIFKQLLYLNVPYPHTDTKNLCGGGACTVGTSGCGLMASAMVLAKYGKNIPIAELAKFSENNGFRTDGGTSHDYFPAIATLYGFQEENLANWVAIKAHLEKNEPVIVSGQSKNPSTGVHGPANPPFTDGGHYIVLTGIKNGAVTVNDSWGGTERDNQSYPEDLIHTAYTTGAAFLITP